MNYVKRNATVTAVQWCKPGDHPLVEAAGPKVYEQGGCYYISGMSTDDRKLSAHAWLSEELKEKPTPGAFSYGMQAVTEVGGSEVYYRLIYPFSMYDMKGPKSERPLDMTDPLDKRRFEDWHTDLCRKAQRSVGVAPYGLLNPADRNGRVAVFPYDWIVTNPDGTVEIIDKDKFDDLYVKVS